MTCLKRKLAVDTLSPGEKGGALFARLIVEYSPAKPIGDKIITNWSQSHPDSGTKKPELFMAPANAQFQSFLQSVD